MTRRPTLALSFAAVACTACTLFAQQPGGREPTAGRVPFVDPTADTVVVGLDGPMRLRAAFLSTNLGTTLAAKEAESFWGALRAPVENAFASLDDEGGDRVAGRLLRALDGYGGRITLALDAVPNPQAWAGVAPDLSGVLVLSPARGSDLVAIGSVLEAALRGLTETVDREPVTKSFGDLDLELVTVGTSKNGFARPVVHDDHLVVFFGEKVEAGIARRVARAPAADADADAANAPARRAPLAARVDLERLVELAQQDASLGMFTQDTGKAFEAFGFSSLDDLQLVVRPAGPRVQIEMSIGFLDERPRGLFAGFMPDDQTPPRRLAWIPPGVPNWWLTKLDVRSLVAATFDGVNELDVLTNDVRAETNEHFGFDFENDLCARIERPCLVLEGVPGVVVDPDVDLDLVGGAVAFVFPIRESDALRTAWQKMVDSELNDVSTEDVEGVTLHEFGFFGDGIYWAITEDFLFVAFGDSSPAPWLAHIVKARVPADGDVKLPSDEFERLRRYAPPGWHGCAELRLDRFVDGPWFGLLWDVFDVPGLDETWSGGTERLVPLLEQGGIDRARIFSGYADRRWRYRALW